MIGTDSGSVRYVRTNRWLSAARASLREVHDAHDADQAVLGTRWEDVPSRPYSVIRAAVRGAFFLFGLAGEGAWSREDLRRFRESVKKRVHPISEWTRFVLNLPHPCRRRSTARHLRRRTFLSLPRGIGGGFRAWRSCPSRCAAFREFGRTRAVPCRRRDFSAGISSRCAYRPLRSS